MKFIHTSDWHIGRQFHNISLLEDQEYVLEQIIDYIEEKDVDALVIAGDIYDRSIPPTKAVKLLDDTLYQIINGLKVPVIIISGNHDSAERLTFGSRQLNKAGLHLLGDLENIQQGVHITGKSGISVDFYGIPFHQPEHVKSLFNANVSNHDEAHTHLVNRVKRAMSIDNNNVLISHCFVDGVDSDDIAEVSDSERSLSIGGSFGVAYEPMRDFNYVALGHLHGPQFRGEKHIQYSGSILKYSFSEQKQNKGVTLVEIDDSGKPVIERLPLKPIRNMRLIEGKIDKIIKKGKTDPFADDYLMVRITDKKAILDAMGKLRKVYPNVLHLEKTGFKNKGEKRKISREMLQKNELDMFKAFYKEVSDSKLTSKQSKALSEVIENLHNEGSNS